MAEQSWQFSLEPHEMTVLSHKFDSVNREMTHALLKSARSGVIAVARDFSSAICLYDGRQFMFDEGIPIHTCNIKAVPEYTIEHFDDIHEGDAFLTNSPYAGNTHHADYTVHVPVFYDSEPLFWVINRAHQADCGAPEPTTYPDAETVYEEGPHFPSLRIQRDYENREDVVRMIKANVRVPEQWHGDFQAQIAAVRTGERKLKEIVEEYGPSTIDTFCDAWLDYSELMMARELEQLEPASLSYTAYHDPLPKVGPDRIPVNLTIDIDPDTPRLIADVRDNWDNIPSGFNLCEATTKAAIFTGIFNNFGQEIPHNDGALRCVEVRMDRGKMVGHPEFPHSAAIATTNICGALQNAAQAIFAQLGEPYGIAEGPPNGSPANIAVISGEDFRRDDEPFVNQLFLYGGGAGALCGHDGWDTTLGPAAAGMLNVDSVEVIEQKYPILVKAAHFLRDTEGAGRWRGTPAFKTEYCPRGNPMRVGYLMGASSAPPKGILGGKSGRPSDTYKLTDDGDRIDLPPIGIERIEPSESIVGILCGGGGYGDSRERSIDLVHRDVVNGRISPERARSVYGVSIHDNRVDHDETASLRAGGEDAK